MLSEDKKQPKENLTKQVIKKLEDKNLLYNILKEIRNEGVIGEENTLLVLIIKISLRLVKNAKPTSSNLWESDKSGAGKDKLAQAVLNVLVATDDYEHRTEITPKALNYWGSDDNGK